jgi:hypothetical protein
MRLPLLSVAVTLALAACDIPQTTGTAPTSSTQTGANEQNLQTRVDKFEQDFRTGNYAAVIDVMPPRLAKKMADQGGLSIPALKKVVTNMTATMMEDVTIHSLSMDMAPIREAGGLPYALLPTKTDLSVFGQRAQNETNTLALWDAGAWYLVRVESEKHEQIVKSAYPELSKVRIR